MLKCIKEIYRVNSDPPVHSEIKKCTQTGKTYDTQFRKTGSDSSPINRNVTRWPLLLPRSCRPIYGSVSERSAFVGRWDTFNCLLLCFHFHVFVLAFVGKKPDAFKWTRNERLYEFHKNVCFSLQV